MERPQIPLLLTALLVSLLVAAGCGESDPDPVTVLDRALTRENLSGLGRGADGPAGGVVAVQALGFEDRVLQERLVAADPRVMAEIRDALGSDSGLRGLVRDLDYEGTAEVGGTPAYHVSGGLDVAALARALRDAGGGSIGAMAGLDDRADLEDSLSSAGFDLYAGQEDGVVRRLDLSLALDDPDNALPPARIRFSLTPNPSDP